MSYYLAIDIETTGPGVLTHRMIAFGAAVVEVESATTVADFRALLDLGDHSDGRPVEWDERTYVEFWTSSEKRADGKTPLAAFQELYAGADADVESEATAVRRFVEWARALYATYPSMVVVTDTASFDTTFMNAALDRHTDVPNLLYLRGKDKYRPVRDVSSFYMGVGRQTPAQGLFGSVRAAATALDIDMDALPSHTEHDHDPRNDARHIALTAAEIARHIETEARKRSKTQQ